MADFGWTSVALINKKTYRIYVSGTTQDERPQATSIDHAKGLIGGVLVGYQDLSKDSDHHTIVRSYRTLNTLYSGCHAYLSHLETTIDSIEEDHSPESEQSPVQLANNRLVASYLTIRDDVVVLNWAFENIIAQTYQANPQTWLEDLDGQPIFAHPA